MNHKLNGERAKQLLDLLIKGKKPEPKPCVVGVGGVCLTHGQAITECSK